MGIRCFCGPQPIPLSNKLGPQKAAAKDAAYNFNRKLLICFIFSTIYIRFKLAAGPIWDNKC